MLRRTKVTLAAFVLLFYGSVWSQRRDPQEYIQILESKDRIEKLQVDRVIQTLNLKPGQTVVDLGSGSGLFTKPLAQHVGEQGKVYAVDVDPALLKHVREQAQAAGISNVETVLAAEDDPKIPEPADLIFVCDTLHHIETRSVYLKGLRRYLKPSGRVAIIDFTDNWPSGHEKMRFTLDELKQWAAQAGLVLSEEHDFLKGNFFVIYRLN